MNMTTRGILVVAVAAVVSGFVFSWPHARADDDEREGGRGAMVRDAVWVAECGACHVPYPPQLLPAASWSRIMDGLSDHFGENAELSAETASRIRGYLMAHAADAKGLGWGYDDDEGRGRARKATVGFDAPLRITETRWFMKEHDEVSPQVWKRESVGSPANCGACHQGADKGDFNEHRIRIPK